MTGSALLESTENLVRETLPGDADLDTKVRQLLVSECLRRIASFRRADLAFRRKYGVSFDAFVTDRTTETLGYSWEVESDAMEWETAIGNAETLERRLRQLQAQVDV